MTLVRHETALRIGAGPDRPWMMHLQVVGDLFRAVSTRLFDIFFRDKDWKVLAVVVAGVNSITTANPYTDLSSAKKIFLSTTAPMELAGDSDWSL